MINPKIFCKSGPRFEVSVFTSYKDMKGYAVEC